MLCGNLQCRYVHQHALSADVSPSTQTGFKGSLPDNRTFCAGSGYILAEDVYRDKILLAKFLALIVYAMLLMTTIYLVNILLLWSIMRIDMDTIQVLLGMMPYMLLYSLVITLLFGSITVALSALSNSRVSIMVISFLLVILTFLAGPMIRGGLYPSYGRSSYKDSGIYYLDMTYHVGNTYDLILGRLDFVKVSPESQHQVGSHSRTYDMFSYQDNNIQYSNPTNYLHPAYSLMIILFISAGAMGLAVWTLNRKQL